MSKIAIVDLLFNWPGDGGARLDVKKIAEEFSSKHEVCVFVPKFNLDFPRGEVKEKLNFEVKIIPFTYSFFTFNLFQAPSRIKGEVDKFNPDIVFITDGWYMKPHVVNAFLKANRAYKIFLRFYAYENLCLRSHGHFFKDGQVCNVNYLNFSLKNFIQCNKCSLRWLLNWPNWNFRQEFFMAGTFLPTYPFLVRKVLKSVDRIIVYNHFIKNKLKKYNRNITVVDSGVDTSLFTPSFEMKEKYKFKILMMGRAEDPMKGFDFIYKAIRKLRDKRTDFEFLVTTPIPYPEGYIKSLGWLNQATIAELLKKVDLCVFPSIWPEPFGIGVLEAMASATPVIVTKVGGMQRIIKNGRDGFIVSPGSVKKLIFLIDKLLNDNKLREKIGWLSRKKAVKQYDWEIIFNKYYDNLFDREKKFSRIVIPELNIDNSGSDLSLFNTEINKYVDLRVHRTFKWIHDNIPQPPTVIGYFPSNRCNLNCRFCVRRVSDINTENSLSKERVLDLIEESYDMGVFTWCLTGGIGEPMIKKGIVEMMERIKYPFNGSWSMAGYLLTNGTLLNDEKIKRIVEIEWDDLGISMETTDSEMLNYLRGGKDVFDKISTALENFKKWKSRLNKNLPRIFLNVILCAYNCDELENIIEFAHKKGISRIVILPFFPWDSTNLDMELKGSVDKNMMLNEEQADRLPALLEKAQEKANRYNIEINARNFADTMVEDEKLINPLKNITSIMKDLRKGKREFDIHCYMPWHNLTIRMDGYVEICNMNDEKKENIKENSLEQIWHGDYYNKIRKKFMNKEILPGCKRCCLETAIRSAQIEQQLNFFAMNNITSDSLKFDESYREVFCNEFV